MASEIPERGAIVSGIGISEIGRRTGRGGYDLALEAIFAALDDAGLTREDIGGLASVGEVPLSDVQDMLRLDIGWQAKGLGFGGVLMPFIEGSFAIAAGLARHVLVYRTVAGARMGSGFGARQAAAAAAEHGARVGGAEQWTTPFHAYGTIPFHAMMARRHMHEYGTTKEQLGAIAVTQRYHAGLNERAAYRDPITMEDYLASRSICEPLSLFDCDVPIDGAIALVLSTADYEADCPNPAVRVQAVGGAITDRGYTWELRSDFPGMMMFDAAAQMWGRTDLSASDVDVAQVYDGFSFQALQWLEDVGFSPRGESGARVAAGEFTFGGRVPICTDGGQLGVGRYHGLDKLAEGARQIWGGAGGGQVEGAEVSFVGSGGGIRGAAILLTAG
jgi:acetyl-CoA acetyltransferase